ncbi:hypothetical protein RF11_04730 [Thelohanellus kitauei]|uniref:Uncharacterized protein n=1 Tax=Thelohanellus kitauei TaxID=669202 RepID=A0A0C2MZ07_THEKT|nr:hypothetical protein RF11_04730 [Thelohanellus kitauei]
MTTGVSPFITNYISLEISANLAIISGQIYRIGSTIGSYAFGIEPLPNSSIPFSTMLFCGTIISLVSSILVVSLNVVGVNLESFSPDKIIFSLSISGISWIFQSIYTNIQILV